MTIKQQFNQGVIQKVYHWHNSIFRPIQFTCVILCQFYSIASPTLFTKNRKLWNERKDKGVAASAYHVIPKEVENFIFRENHIFRRICMYKQPILTK